MNATDPIQALIMHFSTTISLSEEDIVTLCSYLSVVELKKKEFLLQPGQISRHMRYIAKGSMRCYYEDENGQEHTLQLGIENWWINDLQSYYSGRPSRMYIQALEKSTIIQISKQDYELLIKQVPSICDFFRQKIQTAYIALQERTIGNMTEDAYERYVRFRSEYRDLEQRIPQYIIASFLGVTPEFLSYLRKKHAGSLS